MFSGVGEQKGSSGLLNQERSKKGIIFTDFEMGLAIAKPAQALNYGGRKGLGGEYVIEQVGPDRGGG
jgi:hypothetical protein